MTATPRFISVSPRLPVRDLFRTVDFYRSVLGFVAGDPWPADNPSFVIMGRGEVALQFTLAEAGETVGGVTLCIEVDDALAVFEAVKDRVLIEWGPEVYWYGRREFSFRDPEGYAIIITAQTSDPVECEDD